MVRGDAAHAPSSARSVRETALRNPASSLRQIPTQISLRKCSMKVSLRSLPFTILFVQALDASFSEWALGACFCVQVVHGACFSVPSCRLLRARSLMHHDLTGRTLRSAFGKKRNGSPELSFRVPETVPKTFRRFPFANGFSWVSLELRWSKVPKLGVDSHLFFRALTTDLTPHSKYPRVFNGIFLRKPSGFPW